MRLTEEGEGNTNLVAIFKAIKYTLNMFSSGRQTPSFTASPSQQTKQNEANSHKQPQIVQGASCDPTEDLMTDQNTHLTKDSKGVSSEPPSKAEGNEHTKDKDGAAPPLENVVLQMANVIKTVVDEIAKSKTELSNKLVISEEEKLKVSFYNG